MKPIVEADQLSRFYGVVLGLNNVSFSIRPGITGVVGPNGAGKTTLFRLLTGQIKPSSGSLRVFGGLPWRDPAVRAQLAYCPEEETVPRNIKPLDWVAALGRISGLSGPESRRRAQAALERVRLPVMHWGKPVTALSKGLKQRVKLAQCLVHEPRLIILDEPMNGLDPMGRAELGQVLQELAAAGTSVLISSHILQDLEALCREFLLLRWGRLPRAGNALANAGNELERAGDLGAPGVAPPPLPAPRWPGVARLRCADPAELARYFLAENLVLGCDLDPASGTLIVRWRDPAAFYTRYADHLLGSGVTLYEVTSLGSRLEQALQPSSLTP